MSAPLRVGLTDVYVTDVVGGGMAAGLALSSLGSLSLTALVDHPFTSALVGDVFDRVIFFEEKFDVEAAFLERLTNLDGESALDALIPCGDRELLVVSKLADRIRDLGIALLVPSATAAQCVRKNCLMATCARLGVPHAQQTILESENQVVAAIGRLALPAVIKGNKSAAFLVTTDAEAKWYAVLLGSMWGYPVIVEEPLQGQEFAVALVADQAHNVCFSAAIRKMGVTEQGKTWMAVTVAQDELNAIAEKVVREISWTGPMEIECMMGGSGEFAILEINPRLPAWASGLGPHSTAMASILVRLLSGEAVDQPYFADSGVTFARVFTTTAFPIETLGRLIATGETST